MTSTTWSFKNRLDHLITTGDATTAQKYREDTANFTEVHADPVPYAKRLKADLESEVATRNNGRAEADLIVVDGTGTRADLAAALEADDAAQDAAADRAQGDGTGQDEGDPQT